MTRPRYDKSRATNEAPSREAVGNLLLAKGCTLPWGTNEELFKKGDIRFVHPNLGERMAEVEYRPLNHWTDEKKLKYTTLTIPCKFHNEKTGELESKAWLYFVVRGDFEAILCLPLEYILQQTIITKTNKYNDNQEPFYDVVRHPCVFGYSVVNGRWQSVPITDLWT